MNILVTGGAGFIGSALSKRLFEKGHNVFVLDNFNDYYDINLKKKRCEVFLKDIEIIKGDIRDEVLLDKIFKEKNIKMVCHLAAMAGVRYSVEHPKEYTDNNIQGLINLLEVMVKNDCRKIVFASSSSVYGNSSKAPYQETESADKPESIYGVTKRAGEMILNTYFKLHNIESFSLRFFTVYGPWSRPDMAMLKFANNIHNSKNIEIYNNGNLRRDFTYIDDIVNGFVLAVEKLNGCEIFNLGNGSPVELVKFVDLLEKELGIEAKRVMMPMQAGDVFETYADTTRAKEKLGFKANVSFEEGVKSFTDWYKDFHKNQL